MNINDIYEVIIEKQDHFGRGIVRINNMLVFVNDALPNDKCVIKITEIKKKYAIATIEDIIVPSNFRTDVVCPYYQYCGGCHIMHEKYNMQLKFKENKVRELISRNIDLSNTVFFPIVSTNNFNYRNKVIFHGDGKKLGFYSEKTNSVVDIDNCLITSEIINNVYKNIKLFISNYKDNYISELMIRSTSSSEIMVSIKGSVNDNIVDYLKDVKTIYINDKLISGDGFITEIINGIKFKIYPTSFFQVNYSTMLEMYNIVVKYVMNKNYNNVLDLYCGTGTIGMLLSRFVRNVVGVEIVESAIRSANECRKINGINNVEFLLGRVDEHIDKFSNIDSIVVDPPRNGLDTYTINSIININPSSIIYVSCDPATLARDLEILKPYYCIKEIHPIDMFPNTFHVESVVVLERKS